MARNFTAQWKQTGRPAPGAPIPALFDADQLQAWQRNIVADVTDMAYEAAAGMLKEQTQQAQTEVIAKESARSGGIAPLPTVVIDGQEDAPLSAIKPESLIVILWNYLPEASIRTYEALVQRSPRLSGRYVEGLLVFLNGEPGSLQQIDKNTKQVQFVASVPYARRLEVGKTKTGEPWVKQVAPHIVEETAVVARRKFGDLAKIGYSYVDLSDAWALSRQGMIARHFEKGKWRQGRVPRMRQGMLETHVRYPAILLTPLE